MGAWRAHILSNFKPIAYDNPPHPGQIWRAGATWKSAVPKDRLVFVGSVSGYVAWTNIGGVGFEAFCNKSLGWIHVGDVGKYGVVVTQDGSEFVRDILEGGYMKDEDGIPVEVRP